MNKILWLSKYITKEALRNKAEIFFILFFPLIFLIIFGFLFNDEDNESMLNIAIYADKNINYYSAELSKVYTVKIINNIETISKDIKNGNYDVGIIIENDQITLYYDNSNMNNSSILRSLELDLKKIAMKKKETFFEYLKINEINVYPTKIQSKYIDFLLTGVIAISILSNGMFSMITVFGRYKKLNILKRFILIPIKSYAFTVGIVLTRVIISFISLIFLIITGMIIFKSNIEINWILYLLLSFTSTIGMMGLGLVFLFVFKKSETAQNVASIFFTIMMFFSGVYFPIEFLPKTFQIISNFLPIKYIVDSLRYVAGIDIMNIYYFIFLNIIMFVSGTFLLILASKAFLTPEK
ncbi:hypothetical protein X275_10845 [Marinitoga sp. 1197]|uniref:ABC transporter permease n=1 Tax=Marinitoga sp. 1197 TaxID=1428449 RepID=UPI00064146B3|nr:ABC transporter permease [Marinitoga sp. 1197]KLO21137.1 hypothetical protein X275_10845 [Marinitoga sp. 1197]